MSFVITLFVREGIVMASDSRMTLDRQQQSGPNQIMHLAVSQSDSNYKTFLMPTNVGISTYGAASINGVPIGGFVESFMHEIVGPQSMAADEVAQELVKHFGAMDPKPRTQFHVAGYVRNETGPEQHLWHVNIESGEVKRLNDPGVQGATWGGESDILTRLINPLAEVDAAGAVKATLPYYQIPWGFFTLQDAVDFAVFAVRSTSEAIRFQPRPKTVGGPIDILVLKPTSAEWIQRKKVGT